MKRSESENSLFERVGGISGITRLISQFYARVLDDQTLRQYFEGAQISKLQHMQREFFIAALGGPTAYSGRTMYHAHHDLHIPREHFQAFVECLFETLNEYALSEDDRYAIIARINTYADDVIDLTDAPSE